MKKAEFTLTLVLFMFNRKNTKAIEELQKSLEIKLKYKFEGTENVYINLARSYEKTRDLKKAEIYYLKCIDILKKDHFLYLIRGQYLPE